MGDDRSLKDVESSPTVEVLSKPKMTYVHAVEGNGNNGKTSTSSHGGKEKENEKRDGEGDVVMKDLGGN